MEYFNHIVNLHSMYFVSGSLADTAAVIRQAAADSDPAAAVNPEHAMAAAVIALAAGAVIYLYRHRRIKL